MSDLRKYNGGNSTKPTRPDDKRLMTKTDFQSAYENLSPFMPSALRVLDEAIQDNQRWAVEIVLKYMFALPKTTIEQHTNFDSDFNIKDFIQFKP